MSAFPLGLTFALQAVGMSDPRQPGYQEAIEQAQNAVVQHVAEERADAAQMEWERWKRANGVAAAGIRSTAEEIRKIANRLDIDAKDQRELERYVDGLLESAEQLDGENWLKSPKAMAEMRKQENGR